MTALEFEGLLDSAVESEEFRRDVDKMMGILQDAPKFLAIHFVLSKGSIEDIAAAIADTSIGFVLGRHFEQSRREVGELEKMVS